MVFQFSHPHWLWLLPPVWGIIFWLAKTSFVEVSPWRRQWACGLRVAIATAMILALAGWEWRRAIEGMNVFFVLDRSDSVPVAQQEQALQWLNRTAREKPETDRAGVLVFGSDAAIEMSPGLAVNLPRLQAIIPTDRTDIASAIRLATAAFPETGQRRIVLLSDGNENLDDALGAAISARASGVSVDVVPMGRERDNDISVQRLEIPPALAKGQTFEAKVFVQAVRAGTAKLRLYRNEQFLGEQTITLAAGKNLFTFPQALPAPGFYSYDVRIDSPDDPVAQDNRGFGFAWVRGVPQVLIISKDPTGDAPLAEALKAADLEVRLGGVRDFPASLAELQSYEAIVFSNVSATEMGRESLRMLESAVRDFGVGFVCVGGDEAYSAGAYRNTPLETILPVNMDLDSKKVLPSGALVLVIDKSGSMSGEKMEMVKQAAIGAIQVLSDRDLVGVVAFDGATYTVAHLQPARNRAAIISQIAGITADGGTVMYPAMEVAEQMLAGANASLKHCIVLTDGISESGDFAGLTRRMADRRITVSTVGVGKEINGPTLQEIASLGKGRFYEVPSPAILPQIFIKETAVILKTAINEEPFTPKLVVATEPVRGLGSEFPPLLGYVAVEPKPRAEVPLVTAKGEPLLAHWQYGLGRTVAFTSDAQTRWARPWATWSQYRQFWRQVAQWSLRRLNRADFTGEAFIEGGQGRVSVEALDGRGEFRNFLDLETRVVRPNGEQQVVKLKQTGPGHYEGSFPADATGAYLLNILEMENGVPRASQIVGASVAYSPELATREPNLPLLRRLAETTGGRVLDPAGPSGTPFYHERIKTYQSQELWPWLLRFAILAFVLDVGVRRVQLEREELLKMVAWLTGAVGLSRGMRAKAPSTPTLASLLERREREETPRREVEGLRPKASPSRVAPEKAVFQTARPSRDTTAPAPEPANEESAGMDAETPTTTNRLLAAKRRALRRKDEG